MHIPSSIRTPLILNELKDAGFNGRERVTERTAEPPRKRHDRNANGRSGRISMVVVKGNRGKVELLYLGAEPMLDRCQQAILSNLRAVARIPVIEAKN